VSHYSEPQLFTATGMAKFIESTPSLTDLTVVENLDVGGDPNMFYECTAQLENLLKSRGGQFLAAISKFSSL
jgi:hypothetical protein